MNVGKKEGGKIFAEKRLVSSLARHDDAVGEILSRERSSTQ